MAADRSNGDYEECRRQRIEENKKRMEELNLFKLAAAVAPTPKKTSSGNQSKPRKVRQRLELSSADFRRSSRVASLSAVSYKEINELDLSERARRFTRGHSRRDLSNRVYASDEVRQYAIRRAEDLEEKLGRPSFVKPMLQSHVTGGFWVGLPRTFCMKHLPKRNEEIILVDEAGEEHPTKYLALKNGLSGGWRGFAIDHELVDGDALVFELVKPTVLNVHIVRAYVSEEEEPEEDENEATKANPLDRKAKRVRASKIHYP